MISISCTVFIVLCSRIQVIANTSDTSLTREERAAFQRKPKTYSVGSFIFLTIPQIR